MNASCYVRIINDDRGGHAKTTGLDGVPPVLRARIAAAALLVASGKLICEAAEELGLRRDDLYYVKSKYRRCWEAECAIARAQLEKVGQQFPESSTRAHVKAGIRQATALYAAGLTRDEVAAAVDVPVTTIDCWRTDHRKLWDAELGRAMEAAIILVRSQAGTDAVLADPAEYVRRARAADRWAARTGRELFAVGEAPTMTAFYRSYYVPTRLSESCPKTRETYEESVRLWALVTGDPPLKDITVELLARFKGVLQKLPGAKPGTWMSPNTVRSRLRHLQCILDKAGAPGYRNRDAAGVVDHPMPWIKPPRAEEKLPRIIPLQRLNDVYLASVAMEQPRIAGIKAPAWWKALLVVTFNTQLRRRSLFELRMEEIDWQGHRLLLPAGRLKSHKPARIYLNAPAMGHLQGVRTDRELVFPWPYAKKDFYRHFHKLQDAAAIPRKDHFGLHDLRRTAATLLFEDSPEAAQYALGHSSMGTTVKHYVNGTSLMAKALDALPQPEAFAVS